MATISLSVIFENKGQSIRCIYLNDHRITGSKPYVSENLPQIDYDVDLDELRKALNPKLLEQLMEYHYD